MMMTINELATKLNMPARLVCSLINRITGQSLTDFEQKLPTDIYDKIIKEVSATKKSKLGLNSSITKKTTLSVAPKAPETEEKDKNEAIPTEPKPEKVEKKTVHHEEPIQKPIKSLQETGKFNRPNPERKNRLKVKIPETITVGELAHLMSIKSAEIVKTLMNLGILATINQTIDQDTSEILVNEMGHEAIRVSDAEEINELAEQDLSSSLTIEKKPPVVVVMGHVDHGKTSLLDTIRGTSVASGEAGGISQHIGAYQIKHNDQPITFMDTPGHEAFTQMRARGSKVTDIAILLVAADDGVKPQTIEAIQHAKAANVPIIVALNKVDKPEADVDKVITQLSSHELIPEDWGGDTLFNKVSAKTGDGINELLENILLIAEMNELTAPTNGPVKGIILESKLDKGRGPISTVMVQEGTLQKGDILIAGQQYGRVRQLLDDNRSIINAAGPSTPVEVLGLSGTTLSGDVVQRMTDEKKARNIAMQRQGKFRISQLNEKDVNKLDNLFNQMDDASTTQLKIILKSDTFGTCEAISESLKKLSNESVNIRVVYSGVGAISESDINLAIASEAIVIGFNVRADSVAKKHAQNEKVEIHYYNIIYDMITHVKSAMTGMIEPRYEDKIIGQAEVKEVFRSSKFGSIAGCMVIEGKIKRQADIRVIRDSTVIFTGRVESLRRFQNDADEVKETQECGIGIKDYKDIKPGDIIEASIREKVAIIV